MLLIRSRKNAPIFIPVIVALLAIFVISCQKEFSGNNNGLVPTLPDLTVKISSSVTGFVTDENDLAISGAVVTVGGSNDITDKYGFFEIKNVRVTKEAAVVTVTRPGYFKGIKTYLAAEGKAAFFRIKLIPKTRSGNIDALTGGTVTLTSGLSIALPANAVINAATNVAYTGSVNIASVWIDPTSNDRTHIMPGDLRGLDSTGAIKLLTSYGMAAVELTGSGGELLQLANGEKATLSMPVPAAMMTSAPVSIPLWYFEETSGLWKQEGSAVKSGNKYIGNVSHFSFWNCDRPANYIHFSCTIVDIKGRPVQNTLVKIFVANEPANAGFGYTDSSGYTSGPIPGNSQLRLEVLSGFNCSIPLYSQNLVSATDDIALGNVKIASPNMVTVSGKLVDCNNAILSNGFIIMIMNGVNYHYQVNDTGAFNFSTTLCSNNENVSFIAQDNGTLQYSDPVKGTLIKGDNAIGTLTACGTTIQEFINYTVNGASYSITAPGDSLEQFLFTSNAPAFSIGGYAFNGGVFSQANFTFYETGIAVNSSQGLTSFLSRQCDSATIVTPINVKMTEYGPPGEFLAGNFAGTLKGPPPANISYDITCRFRIRRKE